MKTRLQKIKVCDMCFSETIINPDCQCCFGKYKLIELEFEVCDCCSNVLEDGCPADTEFNTNQRKLANK